MDKIFNTITNIAIGIEQEVFGNYNDQLNEEIYNYCNNLVKKKSLLNSSIKAIVSQDSKQLEDVNENGKYILSYVAIDNIDLLDLNFSLGTIIAIYEDSIDSKNLKYSCYITYGPTFQIVCATQENGVQFFSFDGKEFIEQDSFTLENRGKINSTGGDVTTFNKEHKELMQNFFDNGYRLRFSNSLSLDTHQILFKRGGIYSSPCTKKDPNGILDLVFEAYPISNIVELAGGEAIDGKVRILDIELENDFSKKTPIYFGSKDEIGIVKQF
ncbi:MAG: hypothetical protein U9N59_12455 [Campylobacterota bacterium]|nr:hypothetical protein [Campylobacterota bacterium]